MSENGARLGVDVGGTFTDVAVERAGRRWTAKVPTTPGAPEVGVVDAIERRQLGQERWAEVLEGLQELVLGPVQSDHVLDRVERALVELGADEGLEDFQKRRRAMDCGRVQALDDRAQVGVLLDDQRPCLFDTLSQDRLDCFSGVVQGLGYRYQLVHDLTEELGPAREGF